ncbi:MAG TPA: lysophospholipid acyltransferase family protein [Magnetospirillum sp.]|nr:lysophospholipid acyltransferase family protein [Magnetospirillum sp.]
MISPVVALGRFLAFVLWTLVAMVPYLSLLACGWRGYSRYARAYFKVCNRLLGFHVVVRGVPVNPAKPVLYVANHASYLDILILGSVLDACFVAKAEVAGWPGFGFLARIANTVFVDRKRGATARERDQIANRLAAGDALILFPEGTSNDGNRVLPFKSSLFAVAQLTTAAGAPLPVQPVSVAYTRLDGRIMGRAFRPFYAWYGDMTLAGHLFQALGLGKPTIEVIFHPTVTIADFADRKALANHCHDVVSHGVVAALAGRLDEVRITAHRPPPRPGAETAAPAAPVEG